MGTKWSAPLSFTISFIKDVCSEPSQQNLVFTEEEVNAINAWLTSPDYPTLFHMYDYDFERDSLNNMILIDHADKSGEFTIYADGYAPVTYVLEENHVSVNILSEGPDLLIPPKPRVQWLDGYFSLQFYEDKYPSKVLSILEGDTEYKRIETNDWLSMYEAAKIPDYTTDTWMQFYPVGAVEPNLYTVLINKVKILNVKYDYFGLFTDIIPQEIGGEVVGFQATFTTNSPFAWTNVIAQNIETTGSDSIAFNVQNAERYRTINPVITISVPESEDERKEIVFASKNDDLNVRLQLKTGATTTIDCDKCQIYYVLDNDGQDNKVYESIDDVGWISDRINDIYISDNTMSITTSQSQSALPVIEYDSIYDVDWSNAFIRDAYVDGDTLYLTFVKSPEENTQEQELIESSLEDTEFIHWPKLYNGINTFQVTGECSCTIMYREPRKVGDW